MTVAVGPQVATRETARLIASDKVEGTAVRRTDGTKLGAIERVMIDKRTGKVAYAVMTFGGFLGIGDEYRALPWSLLRYNPELDAYELNVTEDQLRNAPCSRPAGTPVWSAEIGSETSTIITGRRPIGKLRAA